MCEGIVDELQGIDLGDKRLNRRSALVMEALAANPEASVNGACDGWSDTLAAYRLFNNDSVTPDKLCLGVVGSEFFDRAPESLGKVDERSTLPIEEKESFRWLKGSRLACELAAECPQTQIVSVADREADGRTQRDAEASRA